MKWPAIAVEGHPPSILVWVWQRAWRHNLTLLKELSRFAALGAAACSFGRFRARASSVRFGERRSMIVCTADLFLKLAGTWRGGRRTDHCTHDGGAGTRGCHTLCQRGAAGTRNLNQVCAAPMACAGPASHRGRLTSGFALRPGQRRPRRRPEPPGAGGGGGPRVLIRARGHGGCPGLHVRVGAGSGISSPGGRGDAWRSDLLADGPASPI